MPHKDPEIRKEYHKKYGANYEKIHKKRRQEMKSASQKAVYAEKKLKGLCIYYSCWEVAQDNVRYCPFHRHQCNLNNRQRYTALRNTVLRGYGNECVCCGETERYFLALDHVNNDGKQDRKIHAFTFLNSLINENFPSRIQILCHNCNTAKRDVGECPHQLERDYAMIGSSMLRAA